MTTGSDRFQLYSPTLDAGTGATNAGSDLGMSRREVAVPPSGATALEGAVLKAAPKYTSSWDAEPASVATVLENLRFQPLSPGYSLLGSLAHASVPCSWTLVQTSCTPSAPLPVLRARLFASLAAEPIEDGVSHAAEQVIQESILSHPKDASCWLTEILAEVGPSTRAGILQCLGRLDIPEAVAVGEGLALHAIRSPDSEVREAAISIIEQWATRRLLEALRQHQEESPWLRRYVTKVLHDHAG